MDFVTGALLGLIEKQPAPKTRIHLFHVTAPHIQGLK